MSTPVKIDFTGDPADLLSAINVIRGGMGNLGNGIQSLVGQFSSMAEGEMGAAAAAGAVAISLAVAVAAVDVIGSKMNDLAEMWQHSQDVLIDSTGRSGEELEHLNQEVEALGASTPASIGQMSSMLGQLTAKIGDTSAAAEPLVHNLSEVNRMAGGSEAQAAQLASSYGQLVNQWKLAEDGADGYTATLDKLYMVHQKTGASVQSLIENIDAVGPQARALGVDIDTLAGFYGQLEKNGISANQVSQMMSKLIASQQKDVEALSKAEGELADKQQKASEQIGAAQRSVANAHEQTKHAIEQANQGIATAVERSAQQQINDQEKIADAQERVTRAYEDQLRMQRDAARNISDANEDVNKSHQKVADAQKKVSDAEAFGQTNAILAAKEQLKAAQDAAQDADTHLSRVKEDVADKQVDAAEKIADAQKSLARAQADADHDQLESAKAVLKAKTDAAEQIEQAHRREADANVVAAQRIADANKTVSEAQLKVADAQAKVNVLGADGNDVFKHFFEAIKSGDPTAISDAMEILGTRTGPRFVKAIQEGTVSLDDAKNMLSGGYQGAVQAASDGTTHFGEKWEILKNKFSEIGWVKDTSEAFSDGLMEMVDGSAWGYFMNGLHVIGDWFGQIPEKVGGFFGSITDGITGAMYGLGGIIQWLGTAWANVMTWMSDEAKMPFNVLIGLWNGLHIPSFSVGGWSTPFGDLPKFTTPQIDFPDIPLLAEGNVAFGPTVAMFGEYSGASRNPEITTPESKMRDVFSQELSKAVTAIAAATNQGGGEREQRPIQLILNGRVFGTLVGDVLRDQELSVR